MRGLDARIELRILREPRAIAANSAVSSSLAGCAMHDRIGFGPGAEVHEQRRVAAVVEDHVRRAARPGHSKIRCVYSQYSASDSPLYANTGVPRAAIAAAAWSCVE